MKKLLLVLLSSLVLYSCVDTNTPFTGYVVHKEYTPEHYGTNNKITYCEATFVPMGGATAATTNMMMQNSRKRREETQYFKSTWKIWVANKDRIITSDIDSLTYIDIQCGNKVVINF